MGKWQAMFESGLPPVAEREGGEEYAFGPPATAQELEAAERALGHPLPADVREMLAEFNGVWYSTATTRRRGSEPYQLYLDTVTLSVSVSDYLDGCDDPELRAEWRKVVFVSQSNGFGYLWGVCVADVAGHRVGAVVFWDHDDGVLQPSHLSLEEFVRTGPKW